MGKVTKVSFFNILTSQWLHAIRCQRRIYNLSHLFQTFLHLPSQKSSLPSFFICLVRHLEEIFVDVTNIKRPSIKVPFSNMEGKKMIDMFEPLNIVCQTGLKIFQPRQLKFLLGESKFSKLTGKTPIDDRSKYEVKKGYLFLGKRHKTSI